MKHIYTEVRNYYKIKLDKISPKLVRGVRDRGAQQKIKFGKIIEDGPDRCFILGTNRSVLVDIMVMERMMPIVVTRNTNLPNLYFKIILIWSFV